MDVIEVEVVDFRALVIARMRELDMTRTELARRLAAIRGRQMHDVRSEISRWLGPEDGSAPPEKKDVESRVVAAYLAALGLTVGPPVGASASESC